MPAQTEEHAPDLTLAVIRASTSPLLLLDGELNVIAASVSFCRTFHFEMADVTGRRLAALGSGEWATPQLRALLNATVAGDVSIEAYEMDLQDSNRETQQLVINAQRVSAAPYPMRVVLSVNDVTEARMADKSKDDLVREKAMLMEELQHRVANSLQIIASVILQSARRVQSEETRAHLHDAHSRIVSVATLQKQLSVSKRGEVALRPYFATLCESLGASMIHDRNRISLVTRVDESVVSPKVSVSLGLIVTELVINALKHAFPGEREGKIAVLYQAHGPNWTATVEDNGVGMPAGARAGLGTSVIEALAKQLHARIQVTSANPGTSVAVICTHLAAVANAASSERAV